MWIEALGSFLRRFKGVFQDVAVPSVGTQDPTAHVEGEVGLFQSLFVIDKVAPLDRGLTDASRIISRRLPQRL